MLKFLSHSTKPQAVKWAVLSIAIFISIFLGIAAYGKFFHPAQKLILLDRLTSCFEVLLIVLLFIFSMRSAMWLCASVVFASWGGYATYWCCLKLPCSCLGSLISFPSSYALSLDILFFVLSFLIAFLLGARRSIMYLALLCSLLFFFFGYVFAEWVFYKQILGMSWSLLKS